MARFSVLVLFFFLNQIVDLFLERVGGGRGHIYPNKSDMTSELTYDTPSHSASCTDAENAFKQIPRSAAGA